MSYLHCIRQPSSIFKLRTEIPSDADLAKTHQILVKNFEIERPQEAVTWAKSLHLSEQIIRTVSFIHALAQLFQNTVGIASFDKAHIVDLIQNEKKYEQYEILLAIPHPENTSPKALMASLRLAIFVLGQIKKNNSDIPQELLDSLTSDQLQKKINHYNSGKSTIPILQSAFDLGITFINHGFGIYQLGTGCYAKLFDRSSYIGDSAIGAKISQNKWLCHKILKPLGFPFPKSAPVSSAEEAIAVFKQWGKKSVVVKPQNLDRGEGITTDLDNEEGIRKAFDKAKALSALVMVEEMIEGTCHRIFVANGEVLFVTKRNPKYVVANGHDSIEKLVSHENFIESHKAQFLRKIKLELDLSTLQHLKKQGFTPQDIPTTNTVVWLRPTESTRWGGISEDCSDKIDPENKRLAIQIAKFLKLEVCGLDFMTTDISVPWHKNNGKFLEINYSPYLAGKSEKTKKIITNYLLKLLPDKRHLDNHIFLGNHEALSSSIIHYQQKIKMGVKAALISEKLILDYQHPNEISPTKTMYEYWLSALMHPNIELIIVCMQDDSFLKKGLPTNRINKITLVNNLIHSSENRENQSDNFNNLVDFLYKFQVEI